MSGVGSMTGIPVLYARIRPGSVQRTVTPSVWPITVEEAKQQIRVSADDENNLIQAYIETATEYCQQYQWAQYITATFVQRHDFFPSLLSTIQFYRNPNVSLTTLQYVDTGGTTQLLSPTLYVVDPYIVPAIVVPAYGNFWPTTRWHVNDVILTYTAGYGAASDTVPQPIRHAIKMLVSHWYWNRETAGMAGPEIEFAVKALLDQSSYRTFY